MRVIALLLAVALIVVGGFWLARDRSPAPTGAGSTPAGTEAAAASQDSDGDAAASSAADADADESTASDPAADEAGAEDGEGAEDGADAEGSDSSPEAAEADDAPGADEDAAAETAEEAAGEGAADEEAAESSVDLSAALPEGFEPLEYLSETPRRVFEEAGEVLEPGVDYVAVLHTNRGEMVVDLYEDRTPETVNNFVFLALNRYYQGVPFHRVLEDFMAQTGDPTGTGSGGPGYQFEDETLADLQFDRAGLLAMANAGPGTNGSQFFITFEPTPWLNGAHTIFGEVIVGEELLPAITRVDPASPSAVVMPDDTLAALAEQGIELPGAGDTTVESAIAELLGTTPVAGQSFTVAGYRGVLGQVGGNPAYGFFQQPDTLLNVLIGERPTPQE